MELTKAYQALATGYYPTRADTHTPAEHALEGGDQDRHGYPLCTLQQFLDGRAPYVSVAMDRAAFKYGTALRIPELERKYRRRITFLVCDTGGAFAGKGTGRIDICCADKRQANSEIGNMLPVTLIAFIGETPLVS